MVGQAVRSMASAGTGRYDLVVFGATGFTGQFVVEEVARVAQMEAKKGEGAGMINWAIAGRSEEKLKAALATATKETGRWTEIIYQYAFTNSNLISIYIPACIYKLLSHFHSSRRLSHRS